MKITTKLAVITALLVLGCSEGASAQPAKSGKSPLPAAQAPQPPAEPAAANAPGWIPRCTSASRGAPLECAIEETAVLTKTGQMIVLVNIRIPGDTHTPVVLVQMPLGLNLPLGAKLQVDEGKPIDLQIQTCENRGCYASAPVSPELLAALKSGKEIKVSFQNLSKETITIPLPLSDFAVAYDKIK